jgi:bifunctional UDP-N-acetylglucosamine pyrophosphorylase/glucosamine-1-phosphate N-acetyltransferase
MKDQMSTNVHIVILAAGKGTRMKSELPKVLHQVGGQPMLSLVLRTATALQPESITVVVGHMAESVKAMLAKDWPSVETVTQEPQLGTGHALLQTEPLLSGKTGTVLLLSGDAPLLQPETLHALLAHHRSTGSQATPLTTSVKNPTGYGRIVRSQSGDLLRIVEHRDATEAERAIHEINSSIYAFELAPLFDGLRKIASANAQGEYYLPDLIGIYRAQNQRVEAHEVPEESMVELLGINSRAELAHMNALLRDRRNAAAMANGVTLIDPATTWIGADVEIGPDTVIHPNVYLEGQTRIGTGCELQAGTRIVNSTLANDVLIQNYCVIKDSRIETGAILGPFAHIRPESVVGPGAHVGNFTELKKTHLGPGSKANHLAYLGDATIGAGVNIGAGVITCNYDGVKKHPTIIEDNVFVGTDSQLVAPVTLGKGSYIGAGSSITEDVPPGALAIARSRQTNKEGWATAKAAKKKDAK